MAALQQLKASVGDLKARENAAEQEEHTAVSNLR
jgi:hypothetical protein